MAVIRGELDEDDDGSPWEPLWDPKLAVELIGKRVLVGITDLASNGAVLGRRQFHGYAIRAHRRVGIAVRLDGPRAGEEMVLPADTRAFRRATPGKYRLQPTGEVVTDPDFLMTWSVRERNAAQDR